MKTVTLTPGQIARAEKWDEMLHSIGKGKFGTVQFQRDCLNFKTGDVVEGFITSNIYSIAPDWTVNIYVPETEIQHCNLTIEDVTVNL